jgi:hypothetical protein
MGKKCKEGIYDMRTATGECSRRMKWVGHVARMEARRGVYRVLVRKPE